MSGDVARFERVAYDVVKFYGSESQLIVIDGQA